MNPHADSPMARPDPAANAVPGQEFVYGTIQALWGALARRRFRAEFDRVQAFCLFVGYPRSGHSVVGAMLNAHRQAVISHELDALRYVLAGDDRDTLYARILGRAAWFNLRGNRSNYSYQVPNAWQGRFESLRVIGDKGGGWAAQWLGAHPELLDTLRATVRTSLRLIHVVRNPFDNVAAISRWHRLSLDESIDFYFSHCETTGALNRMADDAEVLTVHHEAFIRAPAPTLSAVCEFLGLAADDEYLAACSSIVFGRPTNTRQRVAWTAAQLAEVDRRRERYPFLAQYEFASDAEPDDAAAVTSSNAGRESGSHTDSRRGPSALDRIGAFLNPHVRV